MSIASYEKFVKTKTGKKKKTTFWYFQVIISTNPVKRKTFKGYKTKSEARTAELKWREAHKDGVQIEKEYTFDEIVKDLYIEHSKKVHAKGTTDNYENYYNKHLTEFKGLKIKNITPLKVQEWYDDNCKSKSPYMLNGCRKLLLASFNYAKKLKLIRENPFEDLPHTKEAKKNRNRFTREEVAFLIQLCKKEMPHYYLAFVLACLTGMRVGEYVALRKEDIDFKKHIITVNKQYYRGEIKETKTVDSTRVVNISNTVIDAIKFHCKKYKIFRGYLFPSEKKEGYPISSRTLNRYFKKFLKSANYIISYMRQHDLRGQYVDIMHANKISPIYTSRQVGHSSTRMIENTYTQILPDVVDMANNAIDQMFGN